MDEKLGGDEGYKDGCWTPIREGSSLVSRQSGERRGDGINTRQYPGRDCGVCRSDSAPLWCLSAVMGISPEPRDRNACLQSLTSTGQWREELSCEECDGVKPGVNQPSISDGRKHNSLCTLLLSSAWNEFNLMPVNITTPLNNFIATQLQFLVVVTLKLVSMQTLLYFVTPGSLTVLIAT